jgi:hypothetical protein
MSTKFVFDASTAYRAFRPPNHSEFQLITNYFWTARETCQTLRSAQPVLCEDHHPALTVRNFRHLVLSPLHNRLRVPFPINIYKLRISLDLLLNRPGPLHPSPSLNAVTPWPTYHVVPNPSACIVMIVIMVSDCRFDVAPTEACYSWRRYASQRAALDAF